MSDYTISLKGVDDLQKKLARFKPEVSAALMAGAITIKGKVAKYPPRKSVQRFNVYGESFQSDKQRRWFFAVGIHQTPYKRTGKLGQSWAISQSFDGFRIIIGNNTPYGPFVQDAEQQSLLHKDIGWETYQAMADKYAPEVVAKIKKAIDML